MKFITTVLCAFAWSMVGVEAVLDDFYCGDQNCYDVLGVPSTAKPKEIMKAYRSLAKKYHPDVRRQEPDDEKRRAMEDAYIMLNKAYETLNTVESRKEYDGIVADSFRYRVLKRKYYGGGKNVYIHPVVPILLILIAGSVLQQLNRKSMMGREKRRCMTEVFQNEKWLAETAGKIEAANLKEEMAKLKKSNKAQWEKRALKLNPVEFILHVKPVQTEEIFAVQAIKFPYTAAIFLMQFIADYGKAGGKLTRAEKIKRTANALGFSEAQLIRNTDKTIISDGENLGDLNDLLKLKLWKSKNLDAWQKEKMEAILKKIPKQNREQYRKQMEQERKDARASAGMAAFNKQFSKLD